MYVCLHASRSMWVATLGRGAMHSVDDSSLARVRVMEHPTTEGIHARHRSQGLAKRTCVLTVLRYSRGRAQILQAMDRNPKSASLQFPQVMALLTGCGDCRRGVHHQQAGWMVYALLSQGQSRDAGLLIGSITPSQGKLRNTQ